MYLDPSFGGMLLQILVAVAAGGGAIAFGMRRKIKMFFTKNKNSVTKDITRQSTANGDDGIVDMLAEKNNG
jgi:hypothetical protein